MFSVGIPVMKMAVAAAMVYASTVISWESAANAYRSFWHRGTFAIQA